MRGLQLRWLLFALAVLAVRFSFAQAPTGTIAGVVTDQSGGVIANAAVTIVNKETGASRSVISAERATSTLARNAARTSTTSSFLPMTVFLPGSDRMTERTTRAHPTMVSSHRGG